MMLILALLTDNDKKLRLKCQYENNSMKYVTNNTFEYYLMS